MIVRQTDRDGNWGSCRAVTPDCSFARLAKLAVLGVWAGILLLSLALSSASPVDSTNVMSEELSSETQQKNLEKKRLLIGGDANFPPYQFIDENGEPAGFYVDLTRALARHLDIDVVLLPGNWKAVRDGLEHGDIDVLQSMFFSEERSRMYYFSLPHTVVPYVIATQRGIEAPRELSELSEMRVAVMAGDIMHDAMIGLGYETNLVLVDLQETALDRLDAGDVDCALVAKVPAYYWSKKHRWNNIYIPDHAVLMAEACFAVLPENRAVGELFSAGLSILKETGEYRVIRTKWLSPYEPQAISMKRVLVIVAWAVVPLCILLALVLLWSRSLRHQVISRTAELAREADGHREAKIRVTETLNQAQGLLQEADIARNALLTVVGNQKATEKKLRKSEESFRNLYESMSEGVAIHSIVYENRKAVDYVIESVNPAFERLLDRKADDIIRKTGREAYGDELPLDFDVCARVADTALPAQFELEALKSGRTFFVSLSSPGHGSFAAFLQDITQRKQAEREYKRLMAAIEQTGEVIVITDPKGVVQYVNPAFEKVRGLTHSEVIGKNASGFESGEQSTEFYAEVWSTLRSGRVWVGRFANRRKDGTLYPEDATISPVHDESGRIINFVMASRDVTEQLRMSEHLHHVQRMESIGRLAGGVAHDFNNMLGVIMGNAELAMDRVSEGDPIAGELDEIRRAAERSATLTRQLLAFARQEAVVPQIIDVNEAVSTTLKLLRRLIGEDIDLLWYPSADDLTVKLGPSHLDQLLTNLAVNARDATDGVGEIVIETQLVDVDEEFCAIHSELKPGPYVLLVFSDTGCGMDAKILRNIFEPFFTTKGLGKGTGLGLATVYGIVKQNSGLITVYSELGRGTTFKIYLPHAETDSSALSDSAVFSFGKTRKETILIVEDHAAVLQMTQTMLKKMGYTVISALSPEAARKVVTESGTHIDLLLTDIHLRGMSGLELARDLVAVFPRLRCVFMSGEPVDLSSDDFSFQDGCQFLQKPFTIGELSAIITVAFEYLGVRGSGFLASERSI